MTIVWFLVIICATAESTGRGRVSLSVREIIQGIKGEPKGRKEGRKKTKGGNEEKLWSRFFAAARLSNGFFFALSGRWWILQPSELASWVE